VKRAAPLLALIALVGCSYPHLIEDGKVDERYLARVQRNVARVTSLSVGEAVPYAVISEAQARAKFEKDLDRELTADAAVAQAKALRAFGFVRGPLDVRKVLLDLLAEQAAAFYDPVEKKYFFIDKHVSLGFSGWVTCWATNRDLPNEITAAHELVHALQDREHDLDKWWRGAGDDEDAQLARQAVIEGEATYFGLLAMGLKDVDIERDDLLEGGSGDAFERAPPVLRELLVFPYWAGYALARSAREIKHERDLWKDPPSSTWEVLHRKRPPRAAALSLEERSLDAPWKLVRENTLGAFLAGVLLGRTDTPGWIADRYRVFEDGERLALVWIVELDRPDEAAAFAEAYRRFQVGKRSGAKSIELAGTRVTIVEAPDEETLRALSAPPPRPSPAPRERESPPGK
jgi:hypothetical protein